jgi:hypothetical protein
MTASAEELRLMLAWSRAFAAETKKENTQHEHDLVVAYRLLRTRRPQLYVELGRGQGCSTLNAAMAFAANGAGSIVSYDLHALTAHDLLPRMKATGVDIDLRIGDIRAFDAGTWAALTAGKRSVAVLVDAHEETGAPVAGVLLPYVAAHPEIDWLLMFHDVLFVEDPILFDAFDRTYTKVHPFLSRWPEYAAILPAVQAMQPTHFARLGREIDDVLIATDTERYMAKGRSLRHGFLPSADPDDIEARFSLLRRSSTMALLRPARG